MYFFIKDLAINARIQQIAIKLGWRVSYNIKIKTYINTYVLIATTCQLSENTNNYVLNEHNYNTIAQSILKQIHCG